MAILAITQTYWLKAQYQTMWWLFWHFSLTLCYLPIWQLVVLLPVILTTNSQRTEYARSPVVIGRKFHIRQAAASQRVFSDCDKYSGERSRFTLPAAGCARCIFMWICIECGPGPQGFFSIRSCSGICWPERLEGIMRTGGCQNGCQDAQGR
jgi:hypothetical protein